MSVHLEDVCIHAGYPYTVYLQDGRQNHEDVLPGGTLQVKALTMDSLERETTPGGTGRYFLPQASQILKEAKSPMLEAPEGDYTRGKAQVFSTDMYRYM